MPKVERVVFNVETPWEQHQTRSMVDALEWLEEQVIDKGHFDGFEVTLTVDAVLIEDSRG